MSAEQKQTGLFLYLYSEQYHLMRTLLLLLLLPSCRTDNKLVFAGCAYYQRARRKVTTLICFVVAAA